jgi:hypothetical protein
MINPKSFELPDDIVNLPANMLREATDWLGERHKYYLGVHDIRRRATEDIWEMMETLDYPNDADDMKELKRRCKLWRDEIKGRPTLFIKSKVQAWRDARKAMKASGRGGK